MQRYVLDTNVWIRAFRDAGANQALEAFHRVHGPGEFLCSVVAHELRAGVRTPADRRKLERQILDRFSRVGRVITPSDAAWRLAGDVFSELQRKEGLDITRASKSFGNDVLLALCCRESGMVLVTENRRDFDRINRIVKFDFVDNLPDV
ncbi:MAG: type II toxin-antitoxin system VapC family toxin [bacterium]